MVEVSDSVFHVFGQVYFCCELFTENLHEGIAIRVEYIPIQRVRCGWVSNTMCIASVGEKTIFLQ